MARPPIEYTEQQREQVKILAGMNCTLEEIAAVVKIPMRSLCRHFGKDIEDGRANGRASLKRKMWQCAMGYKEKKIVLAKVKRETKKLDGTIEKYEDQVPKEIDHIVEANTGMQIWLSKNMLGYSDKIEHTEEQITPSKVQIVWETKQSERKPEEFFDEKIISENSD
jgi:hypothetical protein